MTVLGFDLPTVRALSVMDNSGRCYIGLDNSRQYTPSQERTMLMHEMGHCQTGAFYSEGTPLILRDKYEFKADEWAILNFLPFDKLTEAYKAGNFNNFELAEYFGVSEQFVEKAVKYYLQKGKHYGT